MYTINQFAYNSDTVIFKQYEIVNFIDDKLLL